MAIALPTACTVALKEWASVLEAMRQGDQLVLIRKGGLIEPSSGFEVISPSFLLYPTYEHQTVNYLRTAFRPSMDRALQRRAPEGHVQIDLVGLVVSSTRTDDPGLIERLRAFHIYNEAFVTQRLKWQPEQPLVVVVVRAYQLPRPILLTVAPHYAGCKSWVDLDASVSLEGARPVLDEAMFHDRLQSLSSLLPVS